MNSPRPTQQLGLYACFMLVMACRFSGVSPAYCQLAHSDSVAMGSIPNSRCCIPLETECCHCGFVYVIQSKMNVVPSTTACVTYKLQGVKITCDIINEL